MHRKVPSLTTRDYGFSLIRIYSQAFMQTGRTNFQDEANPTDAEAAEAYKTMFAGAGTYTFEGNRLTASEDMNRVLQDDPGPGNYPSKATRLP